MNTNFNLYIILLNISFLIGYNAIYGECSCKNEIENNNSSSEIQKKTHKKLNVKPPINYPLTNTESSSTITKSTLTNTEPPLTYAKSTFIPTDDTTTNKKLPDVTKDNTKIEENKKNELIDNLYNEYVEIKKILQYFFKKEIESILDLNITDKESIKNIIDCNGIEYAEKKLELLLKIKNEVWRQNDPSSNSYLYYSEINENSIFALLYALGQSTAIVCSFQSIDDTLTYNIWNLICYITNKNNKANFFNIVPFISNRSNFFYNLCKCISNAGNLSWLKSPKYMNSWCTGCDFEALNPMYSIFCKHVGSNKNDNENKIIKYFSIKFYDDKREIKNSFDDDTDNKTVIDFIKYWKLDEGN